MDFSPDGKTLATTSGDGMSRLWDVASRRELAKFGGHEGVVLDIKFSPDGKTLATTGRDKVILL